MGYLHDPSSFSDNPVETIRSECRRRILMVMSEDEQRNTLAAGQAAIMRFGADPDGWPDDMKEKQATALRAWLEIERLRARCAQLVEMELLPSDVSDDALWAEQS